MSQNNKPYLLDSFLNHQVSWDSEFYLAIAVTGYDDPAVRAVDTPTGSLSLSYAFFPFYPLVMRVVAFPLQALGMTPTATAALAGVLVSAAGALAAALALYDLTREELGESGGVRAGFYLLIFPLGFFLVMVYTEGLFVGLAFGCMALARRKRLLWAALLAALATWTRAVGIFLTIPLGVAWLATVDFSTLPLGALPKYWRGVVIFVPLAAYLVWRVLLGAQFDAVEANFFGREAFSFEKSIFGYEGWQHAFASLAGENPQTAAHFLLVIAGTGLALGASAAELRRYPGAALFGLVAVLFAAFTGPSQSMGRYALVAPALYIALSRLGKYEWFDRAWSLVSALLLALLAILFASDFWVA
jgi:hypothetical protein